MSAIEMACTQAQWDCCLAKLKDMLGNPSAVQRYTTMMNPKYVHPGWVKQRQEQIRRQRKWMTQKS